MNELAAHYRRIAKRRRSKKALFAVAHMILVIISHLLQRKERYQELGSDFFDARERAALQKRLVSRVDNLGIK